MILYYRIYYIVYTIYYMVYVYEYICGAHAVEVQGSGFSGSVGGGGEGRAGQLCFALSCGLSSTL